MVARKKSVNRVRGTVRRIWTREDGIIGRIRASGNISRGVIDSAEMMGCVGCRDSRAELGPN